MATSVKYYAYINKSIRGPLAPRELAKINGFDHNSLVCQEDSFGHWVDVSTIGDFNFLFDPDYYDVSAETRKENDVIEDAEQISQTESEDANAYKAVLERAISVNGDLEKQVQEKDAQLKEKDSLLSAAEKRIAETERMLKELASNADAKTAAAADRLKLQEEKLLASAAAMDEKERQLAEKVLLVSESSKRIETLKAESLRDREEFTEILRKKDATIKELKEKLAKAPKPEDPSWEMLYKAAKQRTDDLTADFNRRIATKDEQIKFLTETMERNESSMKILTEKKEKEMRLEREKTQFSIDQRDTEISSLKTDLKIKEDEIKTINAKASKAEEERKKAVAKAEELEKQNKTLTEKLSSKDADAAKKLAENIIALKQANEMADSRNKEIEALKAAHSSMDAQLEEARKAAGEAFALRIQLEQVSRQLQALEEEKNNLTASMSDPSEVDRLNTEIMQKDTELSNLRADLSEATRRIQEVTTNEEISSRKRDEFYEMVNKKIQLLADYIREIEGKLNI